MQQEGGRGEAAAQRGRGEHSPAAVPSRDARRPQPSAARTGRARGRRPALARREERHAPREGQGDGFHPCPPRVQRGRWWVWAKPTVWPVRRRLTAPQRGAERHQISHYYQGRMLPSWQHDGAKLPPRPLRSHSGSQPPPCWPSWGFCRTGWAQGRRLREVPQPGRCRATQARSHQVCQVEQGVRVWIVPK